MSYLSQLESVWMHARESLEFPTDADRGLWIYPVPSSLPVGVKNRTSLKVCEGSNIREPFANILCFVRNVFA